VNLSDWFLTDAERGNTSSKLPTWCEGNRAQPLIHGATYFDQLATEVEALGPGDYVFFTDWRGDPDQKMRDDGPTIRDLFCHAAERGVVVKGLVWRSHLDKFAYSEEENQHLGEAIEEAGGEVLYRESPIPHSVDPAFLPELQSWLSGRFSSSEVGSQS
jgi:hypothetical protein